jgi:hypothetical protein
VAKETLVILLQAGAITLPGCGDPACRCEYHYDEYVTDQDGLEASHG